MAVGYTLPPVNKLFKYQRKSSSNRAQFGVDTILTTESESDMSSLTSTKNLGALFVALAVFATACKLSSLPGAKVNMFEGTNAQDGVAKIKQKLGVDDLKIKYIEIHEDQMQITVQDPAKPKNFDEYTYERGQVKGPRPVEALVLGNQEFTADKSQLFSLSEINFAAVPETCRRAMERAQIEEGKPELISIDWQSAAIRLSKEEREKRRAAERDEFLRQSRSAKMDDPLSMRTKSSNLAVTWRVYIKGPHMAKDFWADEKGNLFDPTW
jgi:hypothetical protein